jgi:hypothetical protein
MSSKSSARITGNQAKILTKYFMNTSLERYRVPVTNHVPQISMSYTVHVTTSMI